MLDGPHAEPSPEMFKRQDGSKREIADALRQQREREGVTSAVRLRDVGTCHTNGCKLERRASCGLRSAAERLSPGACGFHMHKRMPGPVSTSCMCCRAATKPDLNLL